MISEIVRQVHAKSTGSKMQTDKTYRQEPDRTKNTNTKIQTKREKRFVIEAIECWCSLPVFPYISKRQHKKYAIRLCSKHLERLWQRLSLTKYRTYLLPVTTKSFSDQCNRLQLSHICTNCSWCVMLGSRGFRKWKRLPLRAHLDERWTTRQRERAIGEYNEATYRMHLVWLY